MNRSTRSKAYSTIVQKKKVKFNLRYLNCFDKSIVVYKVPNLALIVVNKDSKLIPPLRSTNCTTKIKDIKTIINIKYKIWPNYKQVYDYYNN